MCSAAGRAALLTSEMQRGRKIFNNFPSHTKRYFNFFKVQTWPPCLRLANGGKIFRVQDYFFSLARSSEGRTAVAAPAPGARPAGPARGHSHCKFYFLFTFVGVNFNLKNDKSLFFFVNFDAGTTGVPVILNVTPASPVAPPSPEMTRSVCAH